MHVRTLLPARRSAPPAGRRGGRHPHGSSGTGSLAEPRGPPYNAPRPYSIPSSSSFGSFAPGHFSAAARCTPRQQGGAPRRLQAGFKHPGSAPSRVPEGRGRGEGLTCSRLLPFLRCWWRGRAHGGPRRSWGLCGGSVGKWFWFNGPLARPGDSALYVILSFITYSKYFSSL